MKLSTVSPSPQGDFVLSRFVFHRYGPSLTRALPHPDLPPQTNTLPAPTLQVTNKEKVMNRELSGDILSLVKCLNATPCGIESGEWIMHSWKAGEFLVQGTHWHSTPYGCPVHYWGQPQEVSQQPFVRREPGRRHSGRICVCGYKAFQRKTQHIYGNVCCATESVRPPPQVDDIYSSADVVFENNFGDFFLRFGI